MFRGVRRLSKTPTAFWARFSTAVSSRNGAVDPEAVNLVDLAAKRASQHNRRRSFLARHSDLVAISIASIVAGSAMMRRREHDEAMSLAKAELLRVESERDEARAALACVQERLLAGVSDVASYTAKQRGWLSASEPDREGKLREWVNSAFREESSDEDSAAQGKSETTAVPSPKAEGNRTMI